MNTIPYHSNNASMPVWVTINEAVEIINRHINISIKPCHLLRYALHGHLTLSIYFQSPVCLKKVSTDGDNILLEPVTGNIADEIGKLSSICMNYGGHEIVRTEGDYVCPCHHVIDTPLLGYEYRVLQTLLASALEIPEPVTGQHNYHYGVFVCEKGILYQVFELTTWENRITRQLRTLSKSKATEFSRKINKKMINRKDVHYFPVYHFPDDACFVIKRTHLEYFIRTLLPANIKASNQISTPLSRFLWLACKHNDITGPLIEHPYKLISIFEQWAVSDGITDRLSGDTLKKALRRGSPA